MTSTLLEEVLAGKVEVSPGHPRFADLEKVTESITWSSVNLFTLESRGGAIRVVAEESSPLTQGFTVSLDPSHTIFQ